MSEARISKLEETIPNIQVALGKIQTAVEGMSNNLEKAIALKEDVVTHTEKFKVTESRLLKIEDEQKEIGKAIASINLKIALVTGAWGVIFFLINHFLSK